MSNKKLMKALADFQKGRRSLVSPDKKALAELFEPIARRLLYGGCFVVRSKNEERFVYPYTVEFYYHEETEKGLKDYIVYHRNKCTIKDGKRYDRIVDYYKLGSINAHQSGIDITFENEAEQYRASVLIRAFKYQKDGEWYIDSRSTYLYDHLFTGLQMPITVRWKDTEVASEKKPYQGYRVNVYDLGEDGKPVETGKLDHAPWAFSIGEFKGKYKLEEEDQQ